MTPSSSEGVPLNLNVPELSFVNKFFYTEQNAHTVFNITYDCNIVAVISGSGMVMLLGIRNTSLTSSTIYPVDSLAAVNIIFEKLQIIYLFLFYFNLFFCFTLICFVFFHSI